MKKLLTRIGLVIAVVMLLVQVIPVDRTNPPSKVELPAPGQVREVLERSCYDCHSNRTQWPWYSRVAPVSWFVAKHVREGRENLNLTEWPLMDSEAQLFFLGEMKEQIEQKTMPLDSYLIVHRDAGLSDADRTLLLEWIDEEVGLLSDF